MNRAQQATFRPLVDIAWRSLCESTGMDQSDRDAKRRWYVARLREVAGCESSTMIHDSQADAVIAAFRKLAYGSESHRLVTHHRLTDRQADVLSNLSMKAWSRSMSEVHISVKFMDWFREQAASCGWSWSSSDVTHEQFDRLLAHLAVLSGDDYWIDRTSRCAEMRLVHLIGLRLSDVTRLTGESVGWTYAVSICRQMRLPEKIDDCPAEALQKVFVALDKHVRRLRKRISADADSVPF